MRRSIERGFTLIEVMIASTAGLILMMGTFTFLGNVFASHHTMSQVMEG